MKTFTAFITGFVILLLQSCSYNPVSSTGHHSRTRLQYDVYIPDMNQDSIRILVTIPSWTLSDSVHLLAPPVYADNPQLVQAGENFSLVTVTDTIGDQIGFYKDSCKVGLFNSLSLSFSANECPVVIEYYVKFLYEDHKFMPIPNIDELSGYLQGNYMFLVPYINERTVDIWRDTVFELQVKYNLGNNVHLLGDPDSTVVFDTPYQLMFSKSALLSASVVGNQVLYNGEVSGQEFRLVNISSNVTFPQDIIDKTNNDFIAIMEDITPKFGVIPEVPFSVITGLNNRIGFEGMYAFLVKNLAWKDTSHTAVIMAHEFIHSWIGVRVGDYDDPWWKEGTANYLGGFIAKRNNLCSYNEMKAGLVHDMSGVENIDEYVLSDPQIRSLLFQVPSLGTIVYQKGAQVNMLLDRYIHEVSNNTTSLINILAEFVQQFDGRAFHRTEYVSFLNDYSGGDVQNMFDTYVDSPGAIPLSVLEENFNVLAAMGAFGDTTNIKDETATNSHFAGRKLLPSVWMSMSKIFPQ